ncbi:hypothetical protein PS1_007928 [Malus domestica]
MYSDFEGTSATEEAIKLNCDQRSACTNPTTAIATTCTGNATAVTATCTNLCHSRHCHLYQSLVCHRHCRTNHYSAIATTGTSHTTTLIAINHPDIMPPSPPPLPIMQLLAPPVQITPPSQRIMPPQPTKPPVPPAEGLDIAGAPGEAGEVDM